MKILITGGAGFIGSHLARFHLNRNDEVAVLDDLSTGKKENIAPFLSSPHFRFKQADLCTYPRLEELVLGAERIYHMAAIVGQKRVLKNSVDVLSSNIHGCERILQIASKKNKDTRILIASTSCVYDQLPPDPPKDEEATLLFPSGTYLQQTYPLSKLVNEVMGLSYVGSQNLHCVVSRLFNIIGPNQTGKYGMVVPTFIKQALTHNPITVYGDGQQTRSFCYIDDAVQALYLLLENPSCKGEIINIGQDEEVSILSLAQQIRQKTNSTSPIIHIPYKEAYGVDFQDIAKRRPILTKLQKLTRFHPKTCLDNALDQIIASSKENLSHL